MKNASLKYKYIITYVIIYYIMLLLLNSNIYKILINGINIYHLFSYSVTTESHYNRLQIKQTNSLNLNVQKVLNQSSNKNNQSGNFAYKKTRETMGVLKSVSTISKQITNKLIMSIIIVSLLLAIQKGVQFNFMSFIVICFMIISYVKMKIPSIGENNNGIFNTIAIFDFILGGILLFIIYFLVIPMILKSILNIKEMKKDIVNQLRYNMNNLNVFLLNHVDPIYIQNLQSMSIEQLNLVIVEMVKLSEPVVHKFISETFIDFLSNVILNVLLLLIINQFFRLL